MTTKLRRLSVGIVLLGACLCSAAETESKAQPKLELSADEKAIFDATNEARSKEKLAALDSNLLLFQVARAHAANMAKKSILSHVVDDKNPADRVRDGGYAFAWVGENIAAGDGWTPAKTFDVWMNSPVHKNNIIDGKFREIGIGVARVDGGPIYYVQVFATPKTP